MLKQAGNRDRHRPQAITVPAIRELRVQPSGVRIPTFRHELGRSRQPGRIAVSAVLHIVGLAAVIAIIARIPVAKVEQEPVRETVTLIVPMVQTPAVVKTVVPPTKLPTPVPPPVQPPTPQVSEPAVRLPEVVQKKKTVEVAKLQPPVVSPKTFPSVTVQPVRPKREEVVTNTFALASPAPVAKNKNTHEVETGAFGDPNGVPSKSADTSRVQMARLGSFDGPAGGRETSRSRGGPVATSGFGDAAVGTGGSAPKGGGRVAEAGFGEVAAALPSGHPVREAQPSLVPVQIDYKPRPVYTEEARKLRVQGEVVLEILFEASGKLQTQRVIKGLGYGLDEAARHAAEQIRFSPARKNGQPYDSVAMVHIVFELAQ